MRKNNLLIFLFFVAAFSLFSHFTYGVFINVSNSSNMSTNAKVAINQQGKIMVVWEEHIGSSSYIYYSVCSKEECSTPARIPGQSGGENILPDVYKGRTGGFVVVWHEEAGCNCIKFSSFDGQKWTSPIRVSQTGGYEMGKPRVATSSKRIAVVWDVGNPLFSDAFVNVWDGNWSGVKQISISGYHQAAKVADINTGPDGKFYVAWEEVRDKSETEEYLEIVFTQDDGKNHWKTPIDLTDYREMCFRPTIAVDKNNKVFVGYYHRRAYWGTIRENGIWSQHVVIGNGGHEHELYYSDSASIGNGFIFTWRDLGYNIRYSIYQNGKWGEQVLVASGNTYHPAIDYSNEVGAALVWTDRDEADVMLTVFDISEEPEPEPNKPPVARFTYFPKTGLYPLKVNFDASSSYDEDGEIVDYKWNFGDGTFAKGVKVSHTYSKKGKYHIKLTVTDDDGATGMAYGEVEVFGIYSPLNQRYRLIENRSLFVTEYLYKIEWDKNPKNSEIGAFITNYKIYRREKGFSTYKLIKILPANNFKYYDRSLGTTKKYYEYYITAVDDHGRESDINSN